MYLACNIAAEGVQSDQVPGGRAMQRSADMGVADNRLGYTGMFYAHGMLDEWKGSASLCWIRLDVPTLILQFISDVVASRFTEIFRR